MGEKDPDVLVKFFFAQSAPIKLASSQAAQPRLFFIGKSAVFHFLERSELRIHYREERGERKSPAPGGFLTHDLSVMRRVLYRCPEAIGLVADQRILAATVRLT